MREFKPFVSMHVHIDSLDSASSPEQFLKREKELGTGYFSVSDHGTLGATRRVHKLAKEAGLVSCLGIEGYFRDDNCPILTAANYPKNSRGAFTTASKYSHLTIGLPTLQAYNKAIPLLSAADARLETALAKMEPKDTKHGSERKPLFLWSDLEELAAAGAVFGSGCLIGMVCRFLMDQDSKEMAIRYYRRLRSMVKPGHWFVEVMPHDCSKNWVQGVFFQGTNGEKLKFYDEKRLRTNHGEVLAIELAKSWGHKDCPHKQLLARKDRNTWVDIEPLDLTNVEKKEEFLDNDCSPENPDPDVQRRANRFMIELARVFGDPVVVSDDCLAVGTLVRVLGGYKPVELVMPGDVVVSHTGALRQVEETRCFRSTKSFVKLYSGGDPVVLTSDHMVWARRSEKWPNGIDKKFSESADPAWIAAGDLVPGDLVFVPRSNFCAPKSIPVVDLSNYVNHRWRYTVSETKMAVTNHLNGQEVEFGRYWTMTEDDVWVLGFFVGDGNAHNNLVSFVSEPEVYDSVLRPRLMSIAERLGLKWDEIKHTGDKVFRFINTAFTQFFRRNFYQDKIKCVPDWIRTASRDVQERFVEGLLYADGSSSKSGDQTFYTLSMTSLEVASYVREFGLNCGVYSSFATRFTTGSTKPLYTVGFPPEIGSILKLWGSPPRARKSERIFDSDGGFWLRLRSVEPCESTLVCDLQIEVDHSFCTASFAIHNSHYAYKEDKIVQDVRLMAGRGSWRFWGTYERKDSASAYQFFRESLGTSEADFERWVDNTHQWGSLFRHFGDLKAQPQLPTKFYPDDTLNHTVALIRKHGRMDWSKPEYVERLKREIDLFHRNGKLDYLSYFFPVEEICSMYEENGKLTGVGRGSTAGVLLAYLTGITHADPLRWNLSLERFMTPDRIASGAHPDVDQDLADRDLLLDPKEGWLWKRFGDCAIQIGTQSTLKLRNAVRDVHRVKYGTVSVEIEELAKRFVNAPQGVEDIDHVFGYKSGGDWVPGTLGIDIDGKPTPGNEDVALQVYVKKFPDEWETVKKVLGFSRARSRHPCGYAIANQPIAEVVPLTTVKGVRCTEYDAKGVEEAGLIKYDFLGLHVLGKIGDAIRLIQERRGGLRAESRIDGKRVPGLRLVLLPDGTWADIWDLPRDQSVFDDVSGGRTETVFQFDTPGAKKWLKHFDHVRGDGRPMITEILDMAIFTALDRKGPLDVEVQSGDGDQKHNMLVEYARRARGLPKSPDILATFEVLLPETYGIICTQEQLQYLFQELAGCTGAEAEALRRAVAKKDVEKVLKWYDRFIEGATRKLGNIEDAKKSWETIETWSQYGFSINHATAYAITAYACAYLKKHFPLEWWTAVLRHTEDRDKIGNSFWPHCGHLVDPPDVSASGEEFEIQNERIRAPIGLVDGVGPNAKAEILRGRPYADIDDFCRKIRAHQEAGVSSRDCEACGGAGKVIKAGTTRKINCKECKGKARITDGKLKVSALNRGVVYSLITCGCLDSLFPMIGDLTSAAREMTVLEKFSAFEKAMAAARGEKKPAAVDPKWTKLDALGNYQARKSILPMFSAPLAALIWPAEEDKRYLEVEDGRLLLVNGEELDRLDNMRPWPQLGSDGKNFRVTVAAPAFVVSAKRFSYVREGEPRSAWKAILEVDDRRREFVSWPRSGAADGEDWGVQPGAVVVAVLSKWSAERPFAIDSIETVRPPFEAIGKT